MIDTSNREYYKNFDCWKDVTPEQWHDWKWQLKNSVTTVEQLEKIVVKSLG